MPIPKLKLLSTVFGLTIISYVLAAIYKPVLHPLLTHLETSATDPVTKQGVVLLHRVLELNYSIWLSIAKTLQGSNGDEQVSGGKQRQQTQIVQQVQVEKQEKQVVKNCECRCLRCETYENVKVCYNCTCVCSR